MEFLKSLFGRSKPAAQANPVIEPAVVVAPRVLSIIYDPIIDPASGKKLSQQMNWGRPEDLANRFIADILECSNGLGRYQIVDRVEVNEFLVKVDGFRYTPESYVSVLNRVTAAHSPDTINYSDFLKRFNILQRVASNQVDEVWVFGFPFAGFNESIMGGPGAFFCNGDPLPNTASSNRRFIVMGFSLERGSGEMLEAFGHRAESIMEKVYARSLPANNLWKKFTRYDKANPGQAECGTIHYAPNSQKDYEWGNPRFVNSYCEDWLNFPSFKGTLKQVNCSAWGNGEIREHHKWWLKHMPKVAGKTNGIANNWWQYLLDPNRVIV